MSILPNENLREYIDKPRIEGYTVTDSHTPDPRSSIRSDAPSRPGVKATRTRTSWTGRSTRSRSTASRSSR